MTRGNLEKESTEDFREWKATSTVIHEAFHDAHVTLGGPGERASFREETFTIYWITNPKDRKPGG